MSVEWGQFTRANIQTMVIGLYDLLTGGGGRWVFVCLKSCVGEKLEMTKVILTFAPFSPGLPFTPAGPSRPSSPGFPGIPLSPRDPCKPVDPFGPGAPASPCINMHTYEIWQ